MRSIFVWRLVVLIVITVLLASLLMTGGYIFLSRDAYTDIKLEELLSEAEIAGHLYQEYANGIIDLETFTRLTNKLMQSIDAFCVMTDREGQYLYQTVNLNTLTEEYRKTVDIGINAALRGQGVQNDGFRMSDGSVALSMFASIKNEKGDVIGGIFLLKSTREIGRAMERLNRSLFAAALLVLPVMLLVSSVSARKLTEPLRKMGEAAIRMRQGDFEARANENEKGELGLLARALNDLCETLSQTIYQLRSEKSQLKYILASFTEGVVAVDGAGLLTHYNPAVMQLFGAVRVSNKRDLIPDQAIWDAFDEVFQTGKPQTLHYPIPGERMLWITISPVLADHRELSGVVGLFKDMTEMETLENTRREYVANISHELRRPLTAMRGLLEPLADGMVPDEETKQRYYKIMLKEVLRLSRLINDMMQLSRLQSGTEYMEFAETDLNEILDDICQSYGKEAMKRGIELVQEAPLLPHVMTDRDRVEQILVILLDNAMRYTPEGGSIIICAQDGPRVVISVIDSGPGIPKEDLEHIFERFYTVDKSRKEGGTGLGLSIAKHLVEKLGETIEVRSRLGEGSCFRFTLKKYTSNAIALGPPSEEEGFEETVLPPIVEREDGAYTQEDAPYEVLLEKGKRAQARKRK